MTKTSERRIKRIVSNFVRSEWFATWQAENIEAGSYSRNADDQDRFSRCYDAAESGSDGSTHSEHIVDMRNAFDEWTRHERGGRGHIDRIESAVSAHFDALEAWHEANGSLHQEVG